MDRRVVVIACLAYAGMLSLVAPVQSDDSVVPRPPIHIAGDGQFTASNGVVAGTGTPDDPYIVTGWAIAAYPYPSSSGAIRLSDVSAHVIVTGNVLAAPVPGDGGFGCAIWVERSTNVTVTGNDINAAVTGICVRDSTRIVIAENRIEGQQVPGIGWTVRGISFLRTTYSDVYGNTVTDYESGLAFQDASSDNSAVDNRIVDTGLYGAIDLSLDSDRVRLEGNVIRNTANAAIQVYGSSNTTILHNDIEVAGTGLVISPWDSDDPWPTGIVSRGNSWQDVDSVWNVECDSCGFSHATVTLAHQLGQLASGASGIEFRDNLLDAPDSGFSTISGPVLGRGNSFIDAPVPLLSTTHPLDWRWNWWGSTAGPAEGVVPGLVQVDPWLLEAPT